MSKARITTLDMFARVRLSKSFFMRDFLFSETAAALGLSNLPTDKDLAVKAGKGLCENVLEPLQDSWGRIHIRSAYRSEEVNQAGNELGANCATNEKNYAGHIWDVKTLRVTMVPLLVLLSLLILITTNQQAIGHHWLGGYIIIFQPIAACIFFLIYALLISVGMKIQRNLKT